MLDIFHDQIGDEKERKQFKRIRQGILYNGQYHVDLLLLLFIKLSVSSGFPEFLSTQLLVEKFRDPLPDFLLKKLPVGMVGPFDRHQRYIAAQFVQLIVQ